MEYPSFIAVKLSADLTPTICAEKQNCHYWHYQYYKHINVSFY